jgi:outer membrane protein assembly factor BamB
MVACGAETILVPSAGKPVAVGGSDWPMYGRDPTRSGYNPEEARIDSAAVDRLAPRFRATVGMGDLPSSSGPVVAGGRLYVGSSLPTGDNYFCFDAATGGRVWSADVGHSPPFPGNVGIGSTAVVFEGTVVVGGGDAAYYALDAATGRRLWRHDTQVDPEAFAWSSPLVANGLAYVGVSSRYGAVRGELRALDLQDGGLRARQFFVPPGETGADIWNSPTLTRDGRMLLVATGNDAGGYGGPYTRAMVALDPLTLAILDARQEGVIGQDLDFGTTPVVFGDASGRTLVGANQKNGVFHAYDVRGIGAGAVWHRETGLNVGAMPAYDPKAGAGGTLFIMGDNGLLFGVDPATGADRWPPVAVGFAQGNLALANGLLFLGAGDGEVAVLEAATGTVLRVLIPEERGPTFSGVVVAGGTLYWTSGPYLNAWAAP